MLREGNFYTDKRLETEMMRCEYCEEKPCMDACPANCSAADFIMAARTGEKQDFQRAAYLIMKENPLGGVCGAVCPDRHCMEACSHKLFDGAIDIPTVQSTIVQKAKELGGIPTLESIEPNGKKIAIIGAGPTGLAAALMLVQKGYQIEIFEKEIKSGGMCQLIPDERLDKKILDSDIDWLLSHGNIEIKHNKKIDNPEDLLENDFEAVIVTVGLWDPILPGLPNEDLAVGSIEYLKNANNYTLSGLNVAIIGGGAVAVDCAIRANGSGAKKVELFALEKLSEMPLTKREYDELIESGIELNGRVSVKEILSENSEITGIKTVKVTLPTNVEFSLKDISEIPGTDQQRNDIDFVILAIGNKASMNKTDNDRIYFAGDCVNGPTTVVEGIASGKNIAIEVDADIQKTQKPEIEKSVKSYFHIPGYNPLPVSLETDFFGRKIKSPFLLSAAPPSDGLEEMRLAYKSGWAGGIMKTSFDNVPIHIPGEYMHLYNGDTYGNCDNVSGHNLDRVCREVKTLIAEFPDRLTMASTGGPVTGNDDEDKQGWQNNTRKLEAAGAMGIEYSLSCPQGGDGTEGDIVSQNAELTAKIIDWIMEISNPDIPKLFKLTGAVTSIIPILQAIKEVLDRYPDKKGGITLANTFPTMDFRSNDNEKWDKGIIFGMSGKGVLPISYLTLSNTVNSGLIISGNGGVMDYKSAANFLALGVNTVQVCTIVTKYGYGIINELENGLSFVMKERNIGSIDELIGITHPDPIIDFMDLTPKKKISDFNHDLCVQCGNCTRCPYLAITLNEDNYPESDPEKCIGCSICAKKCFTGAITLRERTKEEQELLKEE